MADPSSAGIEPITIWTAVGSIAAFIGTGVAIWKAWDASKQAGESAALARAAQEQAAAAKASAAALASQVPHLEAMSKAAEQANKVSEQANKLAELALQEAKEARAIKLGVSAAPWKDSEGWWLRISVINHGSSPVILQEFGVVFGDRTKMTDAIDFHGDAIPMFTGRQLSAKLDSGGMASAKIGEFWGVGQAFIRCPDYGNPKWRKIELAYVKVSGVVYPVEDGDDHWRRQFEQGFPSHPAKL